MTSRVNHARIHTARSLEETERILREAEGKGLSFRAKSFLLKLWVPAANTLLKLLSALLFRNRGMRDSDIRRIVVYNVGVVGDNVVMLPAMAALRKRFPEAAITVVSNCQTWDQGAAQGVLGPSPWKDNLIILDDHPVRRDGLSFLLDRRLEGLTCDLFVNLSPFGNRGWFGAVLREMIFGKKLGARQAVGFRMSTYSRKGWFNEVQHRFVRNEPRRSREVLRELELEPVSGDCLPVDEEARQSVLTKLSEAGVDPHGFFVINPGAKFRTKCWPAERFGGVAAYLGTEFRFRSVITGTLDEKLIAEDVVRSSDGYAVNFAGKTTLQELAELLRMAKGCVTNDTGTMHMAAMIGISTVALFSMRHSPNQWFPLSTNDRTIALFSTRDCMYCYDDCCETPDCLHGIGIESVVNALSKVLITV